VARRHSTRRALRLEHAADYDAADYDAADYDAAGHDAAGHDAAGHDAAGHDAAGHADHDADRRLRLDQHPESGAGFGGLRRGGCCDHLRIPDRIPRRGRIRGRCRDCGAGRQRAAADVRRAGARPGEHQARPGGAVGGECLHDRRRRDERLGRRLGGAGWSACLV
jgi:hypothetical protein